MTVPANSLAFLLDCIQRFADAGIATWVAGGWAEELWGLIDPRPHGDIDLLYPAHDFTALDRTIASHSDLCEIVPKRFSHKRAILLHGVMIELFLLEPLDAGYATNFFDGRCSLHWPADALGWRTTATGVRVPVALPHALRAFRQHFPAHQRAYHAYVQATTGRTVE
jgi:hypothetical protein